MQKYLDATFYNNTDKKQPCQINLSRYSEFDEDTDSLYISIVRFDCNNDCIPIYIPNIRINNDFMNYAASQIYKDCPVIIKENQTLSFNSSSLFIMCVSNLTASCSYINWIPHKINDFPPTKYNERYDIVNNSYYYSYSTLHLMTIVENTLMAVFKKNPHIELNTTNFKTMLIKDTSGLVCLYIPAEYITKFPDLELSFSQELINLFPFPNAPHDSVNGLFTIILKNLQVATYNNEQFAILPVINSSSSWFPFNRLLLTSNSIIVEEQLTNINVSGTNNDQKIITDYIIGNLDDPDKFYQKITFEPSTNNFRPVQIKKLSNTGQISFLALLKTPDGIIVPFYLNPSRYFSIKVLISNYMS